MTCTMAVLRNCMKYIFMFSEKKNGVFVFMLTCREKGVRWEGGRWEGE